MYTYYNDFELRNNKGKFIDSKMLAKHIGFLCREKRIRATLF